MTIWGAFAGGLAGTFVLTTTMAAASELRLTRVDIPFLLGTAVTVNRTAAKVVGYFLHFVAGLVFAVIYYAFFSALGRSGWLLGAAFGLAHAIFASTVLVNVLLPAVHPRMGTPFSDASSMPLIEPPGFMMVNYGRSTPLVTVVAHVAYGAIVGGFTASAR